MEEKIVQKINQLEITKELQESYLDYAMSVIVARALPDARDGLKPVQRRILWAMWGMGLTHGAKFMKSARVVGEVLGKFHPHGDTAVYDTMVRLAQDFSLRYPLVDGQGNYGSIDGDNAAAQRYTEARLSKIAEKLLEDIEKETVDWQPNYDNSREEPVFLPAKLPNLLLNGTMGIAVGMATSIPPHNLIELADALICLAEHPDADLKELMKFIQGPDFPTGGVIFNKKDIEEAYRTGRGPVTVRGVADIEETKRGHQITITEIPYLVSKADLIVRIAELVQEKKLQGVRDVRDESDREGLRIAIELKGDVPPQRVLNQLFEYTDLQKNIHFNAVALADGIQPKTLSLKEILEIYLDHRKIVIRRRTEFDLKKAEERAHILEGLVKALGIIDKVIACIKKSKDKEEARKNLVGIFKFTARQAEAILEMKLHALAALERKKLQDELEEKQKLIKELQFILKYPKKIVELIMKDLAELKSAFPEKRRTKIVAQAIKEFNEEDLIPQEEAVLVLTDDSYVKRLPPDIFRVQRRGGKGVSGFDVKEEDRIRQILSVNTHDSILFFTDRGKVFRIKAYEIPPSSRTAKGKSIHNFLSLAADVRIAALISYTEKEERERYLVMTTERGLIKKASLRDFANVRRNGIIAITLKQNDKLRRVGLSSGEDELLVVSANGQAIRFREKDVRQMGRAAAGIKAMNLKTKDGVISLDIVPREKKNLRVLVVSERGFGKQTLIQEYKTQKRGGSGIKTARITAKTGKLISVHVVGDTTEELLAFSEKGQAIRLQLKSVRTAGRATQGVRIMNVAEGDRLTGIVCF